MASADVYLGCSSGKSAQESGAAHSHTEPMRTRQVTASLAQPVPPSAGRLNNTSANPHPNTCLGRAGERRAARQSWLAVFRCVPRVPPCTAWLAGLVCVSGVRIALKAARWKRCTEHAAHTASGVPDARERSTQVAALNQGVREQAQHWRLPASSTALACASTSHLKPLTMRRLLFALVNVGPAVSQRCCVRTPQAPGLWTCHGNSVVCCT